MNVILQFDNLSVQYNKAHLALDCVNLAVPQGSILAVVGESGSGKSTLIRAAIDLLPSGGEIVSGRVLYLGDDIARYTPHQMRKLRGNQITMIFQDARSSLNPKRKIGRQFVETLRENSSLSASEARSISTKILGDIGVTNPDRVMGSYTFELSGGMCQQIALAMAISEYTRPKLLLADEPTGSLDATTQAQVIHQMFGYRERFGTSIVLVTHNFSVAAYIADHIAVMRGGRIVEWGKRDSVILDPQNEYTRDLLDAVPRMEVD